MTKLVEYLKMDNIKYWVCLNLAGITFLSVKKLLKYFGSVKKAFYSSAGELREAGLSEKAAGKIMKWENLPWEQELKKCQSMGINIITIKDENYPPLLKEITSPPFLLYVKGTFSQEDALSIGIVGTRNPTIYGLKMAEKFSCELSNLGFTIVSGLARGIDTHAHRGAVKVKGRTIGVLGSGFLRFYPPENKSLGEKISENGAVISEFALDTPPNRENFPRRNRIISGLSKGLLVVEAGPQSGALITANFALEQNREVFALPGQVGNLTSYGTHKLLKEGAKLVEKVEDILDELNLEIKKRTQFHEKKCPEITLSKEEKEILNNIIEKTHLEEILQNTSLSYPEAHKALLNLELKGMIKSLPGKFYQKIS